jgi:hypothetical protein
MENKGLIRQRANVTNIVKRLMLCRDPGCGEYARYICPAANLSIGFPSPERPAFARLLVASTSRSWARNIPKRTPPSAPHLPITLPTPLILCVPYPEYPWFTKKSFFA